MSKAPNRAQTHAQLHAIRQSQISVSKRIREIQEQLKRIEKFPPTQPWVSFSRVQELKDLRSPHRTLREALKRDLQILKAHSTDLKTEARMLKNRAARQHARQTSRDFKKRLQEVLSKAEQRGELDGSELEDLREEADAVLSNFINILETDPTPKNVESVLGEMEIPMLLGGDTDSGECGRAWGSLGAAADKIRDRVDQGFRRKPTVENLQKMLESEILKQQLGGDATARPPGWSSAGGVPHIVGEKETLSSISNDFYDSPKYWDVIYMENFGVIGNDPNALRVNTQLIIP